MPKTKISEFSATAGNNTDIDGINIAEGCAPSGINDAIRELMAQLKDFQAGDAGDPITVVGTLAAKGTSSSAADLKLYEDTDNGTNYAGFKAPAALAANIQWVLPNADGTANQVLKTDGSGNLGWTTAAAGDVTLNGTQTLTNKTIDLGSNTISGTKAQFDAAVTDDNFAYLATAQTFTAAQTFRAANAIRSEAASTQDAVVIAGRAGGTSSNAVTITPTTLTGNRTVTLPDANTTIPVATQVLTFSGPSAARTITLPDENFTVGFRNLPAVGTKTGSYTLATGDVGKYVQVGSGGSITIPTSTFAEGDAITIYNNTTGNITITCSAPTAYIAGTNTVKTSMTLATRGVATILFYSATACVVSGNVS